MSTGVAPVLERIGPGRFALAGPLTFATAATAHSGGLAALEADAAERLEVDCSGISAADSAGLAVLVDWLAWAARSRRELRYLALPPALLGLARISELDALLDGGAGAARRG